jgi:hypothetical protein
VIDWRGFQNPQEGTARIESSGQLNEMREYAFGQARTIQGGKNMAKHDRLYNLGLLALE